MMESFENESGKCIVLARYDTIALIYRPGNAVTPFVVPQYHKSGDKTWSGSRFFITLDAAFECYQNEIKKRKEK